MKINYPSKEIVKTFYDRGMNGEEIAQELNDRGYTNKSGKALTKPIIYHILNLKAFKVNRGMTSKNKYYKKRALELIKQGESVDSICEIFYNTGYRTQRNTKITKAHIYTLIGGIRKFNKKQKEIKKIVSNVKVNKPAFQIPQSELINQFKKYEYNNDYNNRISFDYIKRIISSNKLNIEEKAKMICAIGDL